MPMMFTPVEARAYPGNAVLLLFGEFRIYRRVGGKNDIADDALTRRFFWSFRW